MSHENNEKNTTFFIKGRRFSFPPFGFGKYNISQFCSTNCIHQTLLFSREVYAFLLVFGEKSLITEQNIQNKTTTFYKFGNPESLRENKISTKKGQNQ